MQRAFPVISGSLLAVLLAQNFGMSTQTVRVVIAVGEMGRSSLGPAVSTVAVPGPPS